MEARLKCTRCSEALGDDEIVIRPEGLFHERCWQIVSSEQLIVDSAERVKRSTARLRKSGARVTRSRSAESGQPRDPLCPVCRQPIKASQMVAGRHDDLMHRQCDHYAGPPTEPPASG